MNFDQIESEGVEKNNDLSLTTEQIKKKIGDKIEAKDVAGLMIQEVVDSFNNNENLDRQELENLLRKNFLKDPFTGEDLTYGKIAISIAEALEIFDSLNSKRKEELELEKEIEAGMNGIYNTIDKRQSQELFYGTKGNSFLRRTNQLNEVYQKIKRDKDKDVLKYREILEEIQSISQEITK